MKTNGRDTAANDVGVWELQNITSKGKGMSQSYLGITIPQLAKIDFHRHKKFYELDLSTRVFFWISKDRRRGEISTSCLLLKRIRLTIVLETSVERLFDLESSKKEATCEIRSNQVPKYF